MIILYFTNLLIFFGWLLYIFSVYVIYKGSTLPSTSTYKKRCIRHGSVYADTFLVVKTIYKLFNLTFTDKQLTIAKILLTKTIPHSLEPFNTHLTSFYKWLHNQLQIVTQYNKITKKLSLVFDTITYHKLLFSNFFFHIFNKFMSLFCCIITILYLWFLASIIIVFYLSIDHKTVWWTLNFKLCHLLLRVRLRGRVKQPQVKQERFVNYIKIEKLKQQLIFQFSTTKETFSLNGPFPILPELITFMQNIPVNTIPSFRVSECPLYQPDFNSSKNLNQGSGFSNNTSKLKNWLINPIVLNDQSIYNLDAFAIKSNPTDRVRIHPKIYSRIAHSLSYAQKSLVS